MIISEIGLYISFLMLSLSLVSNCFLVLMNLGLKLEMSFTYLLEGEEKFQDQGAMALFWDSGNFPGVSILG